jgi:hypothetical protein
MKQYFAAVAYLLLIILVGCSVGTEKKDTGPAKPVPQKTASLTSFTDSLNKLDLQRTAVIEQAVQVYDLLAPHDSTGADSAASALMRFVHSVVKKENDSLINSKEDFSPLLDPANNGLTNRQKSVQSSLHNNRLKLVSDGEGGVYVVPSYETILPTVKARASAATDTYLDLLAKEDTTPVFMDAGLAINMTELADRLIISEQLLGRPLPGAFAAEVKRLNKFYTNALVFGADNTPSIEYETNVLSPEFKKGYDYLVAKYPTSKAAANLNVWMTVVASGDRRKIDAYQTTMQ